MSERRHVYVIAEAGVNHNGRLGLAKKLVDVAAESRADCVKFQTFDADLLASSRAAKAPYQKRDSGKGESQAAMLRRLQLGRSAHRALRDHCLERGITFLSTPFDVASLRFLVEDLRVSRIKIASGEVTNAPLLLAAARTRRPIIVSTGMCTFEDIETALGIIAFGTANARGTPRARAARQALRARSTRRHLAARVTLLQCTTAYPAPYRDMNLRVLPALAARFGVPVGLSDHSLGTEVAVAAVALGATVIEKHFTLDRSLPGPDHAASLEPSELVSLVRSIRNVELALGRAVKAPTPSERSNMRAARKSLVALRAIAKGALLTEINIGVKRPGDGVSPVRYWELLGTRATRDYAPDEPIRA